jgi:hypothetical protein
MATEENLIDSEVVEKLTGTQMRILKLLDLGLFQPGNRRSAWASPSARPSGTLHQLFEKLRVTSRAKAVALARRQGTGLAPILG